MDAPAPDAAARLSALTTAAHELMGLGRLALARDCCAVALELAPEDARGHEVMAAVLDATGDGVAALPHWRRAAANGADARRQLNLALAELRAGDLARGFAAYEARLQRPGWIAQATDHSWAAVAARRLRPGEPVAGLRVAVVTEQGLGDSVMAARFVPMLAARGAEVTLVCSGALRPLLTGLEGVARLLSPPADQLLARINLERLDADRFCPLLSLPLVLGIAEARPAAPYLRPDPAAVAAWRERLARAGRPGTRKVGLVWQANPANRSGGDRSVPAALLGELAAGLAAMPGVELVNLQAGEEARRLSADLPGMIDALAEPVALDGFAAALAATDLVISVDTLAAHLAGAMGHPLWVLLPVDPSWYWGLPEVPRRWYEGPRLFRQSVPGDWSGPVRQAAAALRRLAGGAGAASGTATGG
jgi:ADP-heptose:LPS heptosyltransferase